MVGNKPKPTALKRLEGNPGGRKLNDLEPIPEGDLCEVPDWFNEDQAKVWRYAIANMPAGVLKRIDYSILTIWVTAECMHREALLKVGASSMVVKTKDNNAIQNPYLSIANRQAQIMLKAASELGFSPSARPKLQIEPGSYGNSKYIDPLDEFVDDAD